MTHILLFHSVLGLRPVEHSLAEEWRSEGHQVVLPDLFAGQTAETYEDGFAILQDIGLDVVANRALEVTKDQPNGLVLAGISMGAGMAARAWEIRPDTRGVLFLCGPAPWPGSVKGTPVQMHAARPEPFDDEEVFSDWEAENPGARLKIYRYEGVGHYFLDKSLPDFDETANASCRAELANFLAAL